MRRASAIWPRPLAEAVSQRSVEVESPTTAVATAAVAYQESLEYARTRPQGRPLLSRDATRPQVPIIEHADVKRMLLAQKAYAEGALALCLYCARLVDDKHTGAPEAAAEAALLLEVLTPIAKSWPSEWCLEGNSLAIQVHGGYGYTRDFPVEQYWRDQRLNMIHEGTHGIQALDLLGRKVVMQGGAGLKLLAARVSATLERAGQDEALAPFVPGLAGALQRLGASTKAAWATGVPEEALANATPYLQAFGHVVLAWVWLELGLAARAASAGYDGIAYLSAQRYAGICYALFEHVLPAIRARWRQRLIDPETGNLHRVVATVARGSGLPLA